MFIPNSFKFDNRDEKIAFMKRYPFATIVTAKDNIPVSTQLPFVVEDRQGRLVLSSHFAAINEQAKDIEQYTSLVIFAEPHAYISPSLYDKRESVPTWNYIAVHAYGKAKVVEDEDPKMQVLEKMIWFYDAGYMEQWIGLSEKFKKGMMRGITAFELEVMDLQGKKKLSQNRSAVERERIAEHLGKSENTGEKGIAGYMDPISLPWRPA